MKLNNSITYDWHKGLLVGLFCLFSLFTVGQVKKDVYSAPAKVEMHIADMPRNAAKKQAAVPTKTAAQKKAPQLPMTQKYVQSGLMRVPVLNVPVKKKRTGKKIHLEQADAASQDALHPEYLLFSGNVRFSHEGAKLFCDSAHYFQKTNSLYAFG